MIEEIVLKYLDSHLDVNVYLEKSPNENEKSYVFIEKTGSGIDDFINRATIAIQSYGATKYEAAKLNEQVKNIMNNITDLDSISKSKLNTDYEFTDTTKKLYRYQAIYDLVFY
ncbi:hypothetical protein [Coprobacillus cateniformis]|uniref:hypothetical protein n=1 Tax=Coprobacillus cateniformis TaxID=100884 RepID=UPI0039A2E50B